MPGRIAQNTEHNTTQPPRYIDSMWSIKLASVCTPKLTGGVPNVLPGRARGHSPLSRSPCWHHDHISVILA
jgi:hypothetical protein